MTQTNDVMQSSSNATGLPADDLRRKQCPIDTLIPYARNARMHSPGQVARIAGSIREYGFTNPMLVGGENGIIVAHGRAMDAQPLGLASVAVYPVSMSFREMSRKSAAYRRAGRGRGLQRARWINGACSQPFGSSAERFAGMAAD